MHVKRPMRRELNVAFVAFAIFAICALVPATALARSYTIPKVRIEATVETNGDLAVKETRTFDFSGNYQGVYWNIPKGTFEGRFIDPVVQSVVDQDSAYGSFAQGDSERDGTYQVTDEGTFERVKVFSSHRNEAASFEIKVVYPGLVSRWQDTAELYWKFVAPGWEVASDDVVCTVRIPVPDDETFEPGENVHAWGHGGLSGEVEFGKGSVLFSVPQVRAGEFAEARIAFPEHWLPEAPVQEERRLRAILDEEQQAADQANDARRRERDLLNIGAVFMGVAPIWLLVVVILRKRRYDASHPQTFAGQYYRDVPTKDHPAVYGAFMRGGAVTEAEFTASLMRLTDIGRMRLDPETYTMNKGAKDEKQVNGYRLTEVAGAAPERVTDEITALCRGIDDATMSFLFDTVASLRPISAEHRPFGANDERYVLDSWIEHVAHFHPQEYEDAYDRWVQVVKSALKARKLIDEAVRGDRISSMILGGLAIPMGVALIALLGSIGASVLVAVALGLLGMAAGIACILIARGMPYCSAEGLEIKAKLEALKRWFEDFTKLDEAVPTDVALWNRLLVAATALGVSRDVVKKLPKINLPRPVRDSGFSMYDTWFHSYVRNAPRAAFTFSLSFYKGHEDAHEQLSSSSDSSGSGSGGGFSGGGGGGFGDSGGGGAF